jgi:hypothetical protein
MIQFIHNKFSVFLLKVVVTILINIVALSYCAAYQFYPLKINTSNYPKIEFDGILIDNGKYIVQNNSNIVQKM